MDLAQFLTLSSFAFPHLFDGCEFPWDALKKLPQFFSNLKNTSQIDTSKYEGVFFKDIDTIFIGDRTTIAPGAYIEGPCYIGSDVKIGHAAYIRPFSILSNHSVVGHASEVKGSLLFERAVVAHFAYVGDSILGSGCHLGAGFKCANLRHDGALVHVHFEKKKIATHLRKFGAIIGDGASLGCNGVSNPGALIEKGFCSPPCIVIPQKKELI